MVGWAACRFVVSGKGAGRGVVPLQFCESVRLVVHTVLAVCVDQSSTNVVLSVRFGGL